MGTPDFDFRGLIVFVIICCALIFGFVSYLIHLSSSDEFKVTSPLKPIRKELVIVNNKVDTLYVYERP